MVNPATVGQLSDFCWLSSLPCLHLLTTSFCWLCHSLDIYLKRTVFFCLSLSTAPSIFSRTFFPSSTSGLAGDLVLRPFAWVSRQNRQRDRLSGANTNGNELLRIVSHRYERRCYVYVLLTRVAPSPLRLCSATCWLVNDGTVYIEVQGCVLYGLRGGNAVLPKTGNLSFKYN